MRPIPAPEAMHAPPSDSGEARERERERARRQRNRERDKGKESNALSPTPNRVAARTFGTVHQSAPWCGDGGRRMRETDRQTD